MILLIILLYIIGIVLVVLETLLPGVILGIVGIGLIITSIYFSFMENPALAIGQTVLAAILVPTTLIFALKKLQLKQTLENEKQDLLDTSLIGKTAEVVNDIKPFGAIMIDGKKIQAISYSEFIERGKQVTIVKIEGAKVYVKKA